MRFQKFLGPRETIVSADAPRSPQVSVIMPTACGHRDGRLERAIESVLAQTAVEFEFVIVDDGSQDGTEKVCRSYAARDPRVVYVRYGQACGLPAVRVDAAIIEARAPFVALMFDDCTWTPDALASMLATMEAAPVDVVHGHVEAADTAGRRKMLGTAPLCPELLACRNSIPGAAVLCRRDFFDRFGLFDPHLVLQPMCDWDLWLRALRRGARFGRCDRTVARQTVYSLAARDEAADWDYKTSFAYMTCEERLPIRVRSLLPANIETFDVFDRRVLTPYLRSGHEWKTAERLIYEPYFAAHPHLAAAAGRRTAADAEPCPHGVKERMRVLLVSNVCHETVDRWKQKLTTDGHAIVVLCGEWQAGMIPPGDVDLLVLFDCAATETLETVAAYTAAGVPISYCTVFGEDERQDSNWAEPLEFSDTTGESYYFGQPDVYWTDSQRAVAERIKAQASSVLDLTAAREVAVEASSR